MMKKTITIEDDEIKIGANFTFWYNGKQVIDIAELPDGSDDMRYCDENEKPLPDSPRIICKPWRME